MNELKIEWEERTDGGNHRFVLFTEHYIYALAQRGPCHRAPEWGLYVTGFGVNGLAWSLVAVVCEPDLATAGALVEEDYPRRVVMEALAQ